MASWLVNIVIRAPPACYFCKDSRVLINFYNLPIREAHLWFLTPASRHNSSCNPLPPSPIPRPMLRKITGPTRFTQRSAADTRKIVSMICFFIIFRRVYCGPLPLSPPSQECSLACWKSCGGCAGTSQRSPIPDDIGFCQSWSFHQKENIIHRMRSDEVRQTCSNVSTPIAMSQNFLYTMLNEMFSPWLCLQIISSTSFSQTNFPVLSLMPRSSTTCLFTPKANCALGCQVFKSLHSGKDTGAH